MKRSELSLRDVKEEIPLKGAFLRSLAPAKINLRLEVFSKRDDGYHDILSLAMPVDLVDRVTLCRIDTGGIEISCPAFASLETKENLAYQAARIFAEAARISFDEEGLLIHIEKSIPLASGLGGGSTDAACTLRLLNEMFDCPLKRAKLKALAADLGADVPFFVEGKARWMHGKGDKLGDEVEIEPSSILLANPAFGVQSKWAYERWDEKNTSEILTSKRNSDRKMLRFVGLTDLADLLCNDLEDAIEAFYPELKEAKAYLNGLGARGALMSGSGPTLFAIFPDRQKAETAKEKLAFNWPVWRFWIVTQFERENLALREGRNGDYGSKNLPRQRR